ncbi:conjugal transfer protein TraD [Agrobacterium tumefaciens]|uniref:conjugal transfer protein TraD n=1 Tax=Agrobacterium tumefaciens TaxID=358 RepID=UPI000DDB103C|nr:conjugal transfer protein TraD [Agrobacterium tumefaciens]AYM09116.1 conjugal transfer protein TraD [Agrobacterium tumefaciens]NSZ35599.1 conjugal transfer protein TraD [Agrobacterium tumefaciens]QLG25626.1 conjugal transfer protein TraD [Agrobacterium tumefaciens]UXS89396.1 conjugal transfer protein TraD [Agrobacterium tumefaciens]
MTGNRKQEARENFLLGSLVAKAGLSKADRAFLLGGLIELTRMAPGSSEHRRLRDIGAQAFKASCLKSELSHAGETLE